MISSPGIGSGLDVNSIVSQLLAIERRPLNLIEQKQGDAKSQLSDIGRLNSAMATFQTAMRELNTLSDFKFFSTTSSDESVISASADSTAATGTFSVRVDNLAVAQKQSSRVYADSDSTTIGGTGDLTITIGSDSTTITDVGNLTLSELQDAINSASDNPGVTASILSENSGSFRMILTSDETGLANQANLSFSGTAGDAGNLNMSQIIAAEDANILVDNTFTITRSSNTITDAISGVTLNLVSENATAAAININRDNDKVAESAQGFVDAYNALQSTIDDLRTGSLQGDNSLLSLESQLRSVFNNPPSGLNSQYSYLTEVGVSFDKFGKLSLDSAALDTALNTDFAGVAELFANDDQGYAFRLDTLATSILAPEGLLDSRKTGIQSRIDTFDLQIEREEYRLTLVEERLRRQFTALDSLLSDLSNTSNFLTQQLATLPNFNNQQ